MIGESTLKSSRLEAFSDGVLAIIIAIMVLEMKVPHGTDWASLATMLPVFGSYVLSFVYVGIYVLVAILWLIPDRRFENAIS